MDEPSWRATFTMGVIVVALAVAGLLAPVVLLRGHLDRARNRRICAALVFGAAALGPLIAWLLFGARYNNGSLPEGRSLLTALLVLGLVPLIGAMSGGAALGARILDRRATLNRGQARKVGLGVLLLATMIDSALWLGLAFGDLRPGQSLSLGVGAAMYFAFLFGLVACGWVALPLFAAASIVLYRMAEPRARP